MNNVATAVMDIPDTAPVVAPPANGLSQITTGRIKKPRRTLIYGVHGIGKSTWAATADHPIFLPTEEGVNDIECAKFPLASSWDQVEANLQSLATQDHAYKTLVVDSLDWLERLIWKAVCDEKGVQSIDDIGYGKGYNAASDWWAKLLRALTYLRDVKGMGIILIAHSKVEKFENPEGENYSQHMLALHKIASAMLQEWCDEVLFASYKVYTKTTEEGFGKTSVKAIGGNERILRTQEKPFCKAKNRLSMPEEIALSWPAYADYFRK